MGMTLLETVFADVNITFFTEVWCFCLVIFACTISFISTYNTIFTSWVIILWEMFSRQLDRWYQVESSPCDTLCCQDRVELTHGQACMCMYVLIKRMVQVNIKIQTYQTSVRNVTLMSAKTVSSNIIPVFKQKENKLYKILAIKVAFFALFFVFRVFLLISYLL